MADTGREQAGGARNDENAEAAGSQGNRAAENSGFCFNCSDVCGSSFV